MDLIHHTHRITWGIDSWIDHIIILGIKDDRSVQTLELTDNLVLSYHICETDKNYSKRKETLIKTQVGDDLSLKKVVASGSYYMADFKSSSAVRTAEITLLDPRDPVYRLDLDSARRLFGDECYFILHRRTTLQVTGRNVNLVSTDRNGNITSNPYDFATRRDFNEKLVFDRQGTYYLLSNEGSPFRIRVNVIPHPDDQYKSHQITWNKGVTPPNQVITVSDGDTLVFKSSDHLPHGIGFTDASGNPIHHPLTVPVYTNAPNQVHVETMSLSPGTYYIRDTVDPREKLTVKVVGERGGASTTNANGSGDSRSAPPPPPSSYPATLEIPIKIVHDKYTKSLSPRTVNRFFRKDKLSYIIGWNKANAGDVIIQSVKTGQGVLCRSTDGLPHSLLQTDHMWNVLSHPQYKGVPEPTRWMTGLLYFDSVGKYYFKCSECQCRLIVNSTDRNRGYSQSMDISQTSPVRGLDVEYGRVDMRTFSPSQLGVILTEGQYLICDKRGEYVLEQKFKDPHGQAQYKMLSKIDESTSRSLLFDRAGTYYLSNPLNKKRFKIVVYE